MFRFLPSLTLLSALILPAAAHADTFTFNLSGSGGGVSGTGTFTAYQSGDHYVVTAISGTGITGLLAPNGYRGNDNYLYPTGGQSASFVDYNGIGFTDVMGNTSFLVNLFGTGGGLYYAEFYDSDANQNTVPVTFALASSPTPTPEPSSLMLLGTGALGLAGAARRRFMRA